MILFLVILFWATAVILFSIYKIAFKGKEEYLILFTILYLPFYTTILSVVYLHTRSELLVNVFQYAKELMVLVALLVFIFYKRDFFAFSFRLVFIDYVFIAFLSLAFLFVLLPIGEATLVAKGIYFKNMLLLGVMYFFGRNASFKDFPITSIVHAILYIGVMAFLVNVFEYLVNTHFQLFIGTPLYLTEVAETEISGSYGLTWTFETSTGQRRFGSFFSNPLELSSSVLLSFSTAFIMLVFFWKSNRKWVYQISMICALGSLLFAFSRASFVGLFLQIFFVAVLFGFYRLIFGGVFLTMLVCIYLFFFASADVQNFIYETLTFKESSSAGHLIEWLQGVDSMIQFPYGIGLAMSGNAGGVDDAIKIGGENQFIIFGVQLGVFGLLLYTGLLVFAIVYSVKAYRIAAVPSEKIVPFVAGAVKIGLLFPLFTSNVETYLYIALISWWMVGYSVAVYSRNKALGYDQ